MSRDWQPGKVREIHVRRGARKWTKDGGFSNFGPSTRYDVLVDGKPYPPKAISSIAHELATGATLRANEFRGPASGVWHRRLKELGFPIVSKGSATKDFSNAVTKSLNQARAKRLQKIAETSNKPPSQVHVLVARYDRSPHVVAERLFLAKGVCEECGSPAPFIRKREKTPYLEVHHVQPLSEGGFDSVENTIAVCPNCHREIHDSRQLGELDE